MVIAYWMVTLALLDSLNVYLGRRRPTRRERRRGGLSVSAVGGLAKAASRVGNPPGGRLMASWRPVVGGDSPVAGGDSPVAGRTTATDGMDSRFHVLKYIKLSNDGTLLFTPSATNPIADRDLFIFLLFGFFTTPSTVLWSRVVATAVDRVPPWLALVCPEGTLPDTVCCQGRVFLDTGALVTLSHQLSSNLNKTKQCFLNLG
jgi:hypothetical protein